MDPTPSGIEIQPMVNPNMECPICGEVCRGRLALHRHQEQIHASGEIRAYRRDTETVEIEAMNGEHRARERADNYLEFGG